MWLLVLTAACLLPFVKKAFHIDDTLFLRAAEQIQKTPANFYGFQMNWYGRTRPMVENFNNPPLTCYYLALVATLLGWSELSLHLGFILPALASAWGTFALAKRVAAPPLLAGLVMVLTPVFLVSATTLMCDVMLLALWVWAVFFFEQAFEKDAPSLFLVSGILAGLAVYAKFVGVALAPLLAAFGLVRQRRLGLWALAPLLALLFAGFYEWASYHLYGKGMLLLAAGAASHEGILHPSSFLERTVIGLSYLGGAFLPLLLCVPLLWSARSLAKGLCLFAPVLLFYPYLGKFALLWDASGNPNWVLCLQSAVLIASGFHILSLAAADFWQTRNATSLLLLLWVWGIFLFASEFNWTLNGRSLLPMVPAVGILAARRVRVRHSHHAGLEGPAQILRIADRSMLLWPLVGGACISLFVAMADCDLASTGRRAAKDVMTKYQSPGHVLWFEGHWGFQYYMEQQGAKALEDDFAQPKVGDRLVVPSEGVNLFDLSTNVIRLIDTLDYQLKTPLSTMSWRAGAGFYAALMGPFPFSVGPTDPERYYVFEVIHTRDTVPKARMGPVESGAIGQQFDLERRLRAERARPKS